MRDASGSESAMKLTPRRSPGAMTGLAPTVRGWSDGD